MTNLFIGYNTTEDFRILICAWCEEEAKKLAEEYRVDAKLEGSFDISVPDKGIDDIHFDCDYVIA